MISIFLNVVFFGLLLATLVFSFLWRRNCDKVLGDKKDELKTGDDQ